MSIDLQETKQESPSEQKSKRSGDFVKLKRRIFKKMGKAIEDFSLIEEGDHIMVAISGGKDSWAMLYLLEEMRRKAPINFTLFAVHLDQGEPFAPHEKIEEFLSQQPVPYEVFHRNLYDVVEEKLKPGQTRCSLCSRLRRGALYNIAVELGCNKIALGHHADDLIETLLLNQLFSGRLATMPAYLQSNDKRNIVIRPLCYVEEKDLRSYCEMNGIKYMSCQACDLAMNQRGKVKRLIKQLEKNIPDVKSSILRSMQNINESHLLDTRFFEHSEQD